MTGKAHAALGAAIGGLIAYSIRDTEQQTIVITMSVIGSLAPDIDHVKSRISLLLLCSFVKKLPA